MKTLNAFLAIALLLCIANFSHATIINFKEAPISAVGDGTTDNRPAITRAFALLKSGDTLLIPSGDYRIVLTKGSLTVPAGVTVLGESGKSILRLASSGGVKEYRQFLRLNSDTTLEGLSIVRNENFPAVLLPIFGDLANVTLRNCTITGNNSQFSGTYCHAIQVGIGNVKNLLLHGTAITDCSYGLFQANSSTGTLDTVTVTQCTFQRNTASDLEFNSPKGTMKNIVVKNCFFQNNLCESPSAGFAVGFANVENGSVEDCHIQNYLSEALHVEDRSNQIRLAGNTIVGGSLKQKNGVIMVLSDSKNVTIENNFIDARPNTNHTKLILVTAGGTRFKNPSEVSVIGNVLLNGPSTQTWYLQPGSGPAQSKNIVVKVEDVPSNEKQ